MRTRPVKPKKRPPTLRARRIKLREENPALADLVDSKQLTLEEAEAAAKLRAQARLRERRER
jgi:hypothetical protein